MGYNVKCIDLSHDPRHPPAEEVVYQELFDNTNYRYADLKVKRDTQS